MQKNFMMIIISLIFFIIWRWTKNIIVKKSMKLSNASFSCDNWKDILSKTEMIQTHKFQEIKEKYKMDYWLLKNRI